MAGGPNTHDNRDDNRRDGVNSDDARHGDPSGAGSVADARAGRFGAVRSLIRGWLIRGWLIRGCRNGRGCGWRRSPTRCWSNWSNGKPNAVDSTPDVPNCWSRRIVRRCVTSNTATPPPDGLRRRRNSDPGPSRVLVRTSRRLVVEFPDLHAALARGDIAWHHVEVFLRAANPRIGGLLAQVVPELVDLATVATFDDWARAVRRIAERLDVDGGYDPAADPANNHLSLSTGFDGTLHLNGQFVGELALIIKSVLTAHTQQIRDPCVAARTHVRVE
ncbi:MAG: DUF222 domain-containing protein [Microthrixaceae bacterium]